jgi:hypothetical protein
LTVPVALTVQTERVEEVALNTVPLPEVVKVGLKLPPTVNDVGMLVIDTVGVGRGAAGALEDCVVAVLLAVV